MSKNSGADRRSKASIELFFRREMAKAAAEQAHARREIVLKEHPGTRWDARKNTGFGFKLRRDVPERPKHLLHA